jgi:hypothetical protein
MVIFSRCAQQVSPSGGPIDKNPPQSAGATPDSGTVNFNSKKIELSFNEYIQLKDPGQVVISPPMNEPPEIKAQKKTITIKFNESLKPNTSYVINFGKAIADITEGNSLNDYAYIFSTGSTIDTLVVKGKMNNAFTASPEKGALVMLFGKERDSALVKGLPDYVAKTDESGNFKITNVAPGSYQIFGLQDKNQNYTSEPEEAVAFSDSLIEAGASQVLLSSFIPEPDKIQIQKVSSLKYGQLRIIFNKPVKELELKSLQTSKRLDLFREFSITKDTVNFWGNELKADSLTAAVHFDGQVDTIEVRLVKKNTPGVRGGGSAKVQLVASVNSTTPLLPEKNLSLLSSSPIRSIDTTGWHFMREGKKIFPAIRFDISQPMQVHINIKAEPSDSAIKVLIPANKITDVIGETNDSTRFSFHVADPENLGNIVLKIKSQPIEGQYVIYLLNDQGALIRTGTAKGNTSLSFESLQPGNYKLKVLEDSNENGLWDTGNLKKKRKAEKFQLNPASIVVKANWDQEIEWEIKL